MNIKRSHGFDQAITIRTRFFTLIFYWHHPRDWKRHMEKAGGR